jgi:hypothetical protein
MAAGAVIFGGIAVGPAVAVGGFVIAHQGEKALTKATEYAASVDRACAQLDAAAAFLARAGKRVDELSDVIASLDQRANAAVRDLWCLADHFDPNNDEHVRRFAMAMQLAKGLSDLTRVPIFTKDGELNAELERLLTNQRQG